MLPIGGLKEKILGAKRAGIKHILYPSKNYPDMKEIPNHLKKSLDLHAAENLDEILDIALVGGMEALESRNGGGGGAKEKPSRRKTAKSGAPAQA